MIVIKRLRRSDPEVTRPTLRSTQVSEVSSEALKQEIAQGIDSLDKGEVRSLDIEYLKARGRQLLVDSRDK